MIRTRFHTIIKGEPWYITIFLPITRYHVAEIMCALYSIGISKENFKTALTNLTSGNINNGITFSNSIMRETISVWGMADSPASYFDLIVHETHHLAVQISESVGYDLSGEEVCYLHGGTCKHLYPLCRPLIT